MFSQALRLAKVSLCNIFRFNEMKYTKDVKKKKSLRFMFLAMPIIAVVCLSYLCLAYYGMCAIGVPEAVIYLSIAFSVGATITFSILRAGGMVFNIKNYEREIALPMPKNAIVTSRLLVLYVYNIIIVALIQIPSIIFYAIYAAPPVWFYIMAIVSFPFIPLFSIAVSTLFSTLIKFLTSKLKHKNLFTTLFTILIVVGIFVLEFSIQTLTENITEDSIKNLIGTLQVFLLNWYSLALIEGSILNLIYFVGASVAAYALISYFAISKYSFLCESLISKANYNNYVMTEQVNSSKLGALYKREVKRYFSSTVYVTNTIIGFVLCIIISIAVLVFGIDKMSEFLLQANLSNPSIILAYIYAVFISLAPITTSTISMEGNKWWMLQSLPISSKTLIKAKIMLALTFVLPTWLIVSVLSVVSLWGSVVDILLVTLLPLSYGLFSVCSGLFLNIKIHRFDWENEIQVVKQSAPTAVCIFSSMLSVSLFCAVSLAVGEMYYLVGLIVSAVLLVMAAVFYALSINTKISDIR